MVGYSLENYGSAQAALRNHVINVHQNHDYSFGQMGEWRWDCLFFLTCWPPLQLMWKHHNNRVFRDENNCHASSSGWEEEETDAVCYSEEKISSKRKVS